MRAVAQYACARAFPGAASAARGAALLAMLALAGCAGVATAPSSAPGKAARVAPAAVLPAVVAPAPVLPAAGSGRGGYYQDDGPGENPPPNLNQVPDAQPKVEPYSLRANRPYIVFGKTYTPLTDEQPYVQRGIGSWYGKKFHGQRTSSGEPYDMYKMTAAHPTLPIPSYARLTSIVNGSVVIVRINDRGPFHSSRAIDVSYTAALKLGLLGKGSHELQIERLLAADIARIDGHGGAAPALAPAPAPLSLAAAAPEIAALMLLERLPQGPEAQALMPQERTLTSAAPAPAPGTGYYLQLGSFARVENAQHLRSRLLSFAGIAATLEVVQAGTVQRLYSGPFISHAAASLAAAALPATLRLKPIVVQR